MRVAIVAVALLIIALAAAAQNRVDFAPDITAPLGTGPSLVVTDHDLADDDGAGAVTGTSQSAEKYARSIASSAAPGAPCCPRCSARKARIASAVSPRASFP